MENNRNNGFVQKKGVPSWDMVTVAQERTRAAEDRAKASEIMARTAEIRVKIADESVKLAESKAKGNAVLTGAQTFGALAVGIAALGGTFGAIALAMKKR